MPPELSWALYLLYLGAATVFLVLLAGHLLGDWVARIPMAALS